MIILVALIALCIWFYILVRIGKHNTLLAVACFFFMPLVLLPVGLYWNDEESDIKIPFFVLVGVIILGNIMRSRQARVVEGLLGGPALMA